MLYFPQKIIGSVNHLVSDGRPILGILETYFHSHKFIKATTGKIIIYKDSYKNRLGG